ncbi:neuronal PAS domain-containing protein 4, partial [Petromyzon marinus]|uniref:neuronal PAS domain-containing protein 4 n=1 Tax=Petromyzon marinus TaxID=7757 RepID=UPI003F6FB473
MARSPPGALTVPTAIQAQPGGGNSPPQSEPPPVRHHHHQQQQQQPRSTKGASKARRDLINAEIRRIRELLPLSDADKARLSYLHVMALACVYTRRGLAFPAGWSGEGARRVGGDGEDSAWGAVAPGWSHSLPGFVLVMTREARLIYLSDNVSDVLGYSMVDLVAQGDSFYDIVDEEDRAQVQAKLQGHGECTEVSFVCRVSTARALRRQGSNRALAVRSRSAPAPPGCAWQQQQRRQLLWLLCCPAEDVNAAGSQLRSRLAAAASSSSSSSSSPHGHQQQQQLLQPQPQQRWQENGFASSHSRDMRWISAERSVVYHLEYEAQELVGKSWYQLLHPEDVAHATSQHSILVQSRDSCEARMIVRLQRKSGDCSWVLVTAQLQDDVIFCDNLMISEAEATNLRGAVGLAPRPVALGPFHGGFGPSADALEEPPIGPAGVDVAAPLMEPLADTLADTLVDALVDTLVDTLSETLAETMAEPLSVQLTGHQVETSSVVSTAASLLLVASPVPHQTAAPCTATAAAPSSSSSSPPDVAEILRTLEVGLPGCRKRKRSEDIANPTRHHPEMGLYCPPQPLRKIRPQLHHHHHHQQQQHQFQTPVWSERMLASAKHQPESSPGGLQCTPPYTPEKASTFLFNPCDVAARQQSFVPPSPSPGVYDQLPPTPDSPLTSAVASCRSLPPISTFGGGRRAPGAPHATRGPHAYSEAEREHINVLARQISTLAETFDSYMRAAGGGGGGGRGTQRQEGEELKASHTRLFLSGRSSSLPETRSGWRETQTDCSGELAGVGIGGGGGGGGGSAPPSLLLPPPPPCKRWRSLDFSIVPELEEGPSSSSVDREVVFDALLKDIVDLQENEAAAVEEEGVAGIMSAGGGGGGG